jgi:DNA-binding CsgD family transcriptional regulator
MRVEADRATRCRDLRRPVPEDVAGRADELVALAARLPVRTPTALAYQALVLAERARLDTGPAPAEWSVAVERCRETGEASLLCYGLLHLAADGFGAGDREAAGQALLEAATTAERIGAVPLVEEAAALARRARVSLSEPTGSEPEPADVDPLGGFGLTSREREILGLIAAGLSNGQIAAELFISPKTASVHVSRILAKLGVSGRIEAAAVVHRLGALAPEAGAARP